MKNLVSHGHAGIPFEVVGTMIEMADVAWNALEHRRERKTITDEEHEVAVLKLENEKLREVLISNLTIFQKALKDSSFENDCPSDLYEKLEAAVDSSSFLTKLKTPYDESDAIPRSTFPSFDAIDHKEIDISLNIDGEPNWWVLISKDSVPHNLEEVSGIDNEHYVVITEDNVVEGISEFIAKCIHQNPKSKVLTPEELQKSIASSLGGFKEKSKLKRLWEAGKIIYALSTWGIALASLYRGRAVVKAAAVGVGAASRFVVKAL